MDVIFAACLLASLVGRARQKLAGQRRERLLRELDWVDYSVDRERLIDDLF